MHARQTLGILLTSLLASCGGGSSSMDTISESESIISTSDISSVTTSNPMTSEISSSHSATSSSSMASSISLPSYTVTFVTNATTTLNPVNTSVLEVPPVVSNDPYVLEGWYLDASFSQIVTFPYFVTAPVTLYAKWIEGSVGFNYRINASSTGYIVDAYGGNETSVAIPISYQGLPVVELGDYLFYENGSIVSVSLPSTLKIIGFAAFKNATSITAIVIPNSVTSIASDAFSGATNLTNVSFSSSLLSIGNNAFEGTKLSNVLLPASLTEIQVRAFADIPSLQTVTLLAMTPPLRFDSSFENTHTNLQFKVPSQSLNSYLQSAYWAAYASRITAI